MHGNEADLHHRSSGNFMSRISEMFRTGRNVSILAGTMALIGDGIGLVGDVLQSRPADGDLIYGLETGAVAVAAVAGLHILHKAFDAMGGTLPGPEATESLDNRGRV